MIEIDKKPNNFAEYVKIPCAVTVEEDISKWIGMMLENGNSNFFIPSCKLLTIESNEEQARAKHFKIFYIKNDGAIDSHGYFFERFPENRRMC